MAHEHSNLTEFKNKYFNRDNSAIENEIQELQARVKELRSKLKGKPNKEEMAADLENMLGIKGYKLVKTRAPRTPKKKFTK